MSKKVDPEKLRMGMLGKPKDSLFGDTRERTPAPVLVEKPAASGARDPEARVTLPLTREQKRFVDQLAASLQGDDPVELINRNSLLRSMIRVLQSRNISSNVNIRANSEDELVEVIRKILKE